MANRWAIANGNWSATATWSGSIKPVAGDDVYSNNFTVNIDESFDVGSLRNAASASAIVAGGTFNFNSGSISGSITGTTPLSVNASNLLTFTHTSGDVTMSLSNPMTSYINAYTVISYSNTGNLNLVCPNIFPQTTTNAIFLSKTGAGTLTINGDVSFNGAGNTNNMSTINSTNGDIIINGKVSMINASTLATANTIKSTSGTLTINGNVAPPLLYSATTITINMTGGTSLTINGQLLPGVGYNVNTAVPTTINGNVNGNTLTNGIQASNTLNVNGNLYGFNATAPIYTVSANTININGNIFAQSGYGVYSTTAAAIINITGSVYAGQYPAVTVLAGGTVNLTGGNIYNSRRTNAIWSPNLFIDSTVTTWQLNSSLDETKTLYVSGTFPNLPAISNVRNGSAYGPANSLVGTMLVPSPTDVRSGVAVDNTTGSAELNAADIISALNASNDPLAIRLKSILTDKTAGNLMSQYNNV